MALLRHWKRCCLSVRVTIDPLYSVKCSFPLFSSFFFIMLDFLTRACRLRATRITAGATEMMTGAHKEIERIPLRMQQLHSAPAHTRRPFIHSRAEKCVCFVDCCSFGLRLRDYTRSNTRTPAFKRVPQDPVSSHSGLLKGIGFNMHLITALLLF